MADTGSGVVRVVLVDDHPVVRAGLRALARSLASPTTAMPSCPSTSASSRPNGRTWSSWTSTTATGRGGRR